MEFETQVEVAADFIWIRLHANGEVTLLSGYRLAGKRWQDIHNENRMEQEDKPLQLIRIR